MSNRPALVDTWPQFTTTGIFYQISELADRAIRFPWLLGQDGPVYLDLMYYANHSGRKLASNFVMMFLDSNGELTPTGMKALAGAIVYKYERNWRKLWDTLILTYDPSHNYNVTTTRELNRSDNEDESLNTTKTGTESVAHGLEQETAHGKTTTDDTLVFGFNTPSTTPVPSDRSISADTGTTTVTNSGTDTNSRDLTDDSSRLKSTESEEIEEVHKSGTIGTVSVQQLISEERGLWVWNFYDQVFKDIDSELTIPFYDPCR